MRGKAHVLIFFLVNLFLCSWHLHDGRNDNCISRAAMVAAVAQNGNLSIDPWHELTGDLSLIDGHYYSDKAPLPALMMVPAWWFLVHTGLVTPIADGAVPYSLLRLSGFLCGSLPLAIIITLLWLRVRRIAGAVPASLLAALPLFGSFLFVFSGSFFGHLLGALFLLGSWIAVERERAFVAGGLAAAAVLCEYPLFVFPVIWLLRYGLLRQWKNALWMCVGALPFVIVLLVYNAALTGSMFSIGYDHLVNFESEGYGLGLPKPEAILGLTFSDYRGVFFYMPVLLVAIVALVLNKDEKQLWRDPILVPVVIDFLLIAGHAMWWGGWTYGPRHLTALAVLLVWRSWPALAAARWARWPFVVTAAFGLLCAFAAKSTCWFSLPSQSRHPMISDVFEFLGWRAFTEMQLPVYLGFSPALSIALFLLTFAFAMRSLVKLDRNAPPAAT
ncbi:MAG: hypothetical protein ABI432_16600 [Flavobacteriales bacterium]